MIRHRDEYEATVNGRTFTAYTPQALRNILFGFRNDLDDTIEELDRRYPPDETPLTRSGVLPH